MNAGTPRRTDVLLCCMASAAVACTPAKGPVSAPACDTAVESAVSHGFFEVAAPACGTSDFKINVGYDDPDQHRADCNDRFSVGFDVVSASFRCGDPVTMRTSAFLWAASQRYPCIAAPGGFPNCARMGRDSRFLISDCDAFVWV